MQFWKLFITALMPVMKLLLLTAVGALLALNRFNILRKTARKHLNTMVYYVFEPALVCSILAKTVTLTSLVKLWFMPLNILLTFIIGSALGWLLNKITRAPQNLQGLLLGCCAAGNLGNLPLIIVPAVCKESSRPFGAADVCVRNGLAYASLSMSLGNFYTWTYVYNIVRVSCKRSDINKHNDSTENPLPEPVTDPENPSSCSIGPLSAAEDLPQINDHVPKQAKLIKHLKALAKKLNLKVLLAPSTIGSIVGLIIGVVPIFRKALVGDHAPLHVVQDSASMLGDASIPTMILLVGANLLRGLNGSGMQLPLLLGITVIRCIILPVLGVGILKVAVHFGLIYHDPLYQFVLLLQYALPPAVSISTITQLFGAGETECSVVMLVTYACATVSLTLWSAFFMWLVL